MALWPDFTFRFSRQTREFDAAAYQAGKAGERAGADHGDALETETTTLEEQPA